MKFTKRFIYHSETQLKKNLYNLITPLSEKVREGWTSLEIVFTLEDGRGNMYRRHNNRQE